MAFSDEQPPRLSLLSQSISRIPLRSPSPFPPPEPPIFLRRCIRFRIVRSITKDPRNVPRVSVCSQTFRKVRRENPPTVFARGGDVSLFGGKARAILKPVSIPLLV